MSSMKPYFQWLPNGHDAESALTESPSTPQHPKQIAPSTPERPLDLRVPKECETRPEVPSPSLDVQVVEPSAALG